MAGVPVTRLTGVTAGQVTETREVSRGWRGWAGSHNFPSARSHKLKSAHFRNTQTGSLMSSHSVFMNFVSTKYESPGPAAPHDPQ